jgi:hypothetical protein
MKPIKIFYLVALIGIIAIISTAFGTKAPKKLNINDKGFVVIELFTSEGCSSCPPADELVAKIQKESNDKPVYILAYHVDYWNRLGWKDQFSSAEYSTRQHEYADYLHLQSIYTPQIVVNGKTEFVGSEEVTLRKAINISLQQPASTQLALNISNISHNNASFKYSIAGKYKNAELLIAILQKDAQTKVERGENAGHTLSHVQIVNKLQKIALSGSSGTANVALPNGFNAQSWDVIGFLQSTENGAIIAANRAVLANETNASAEVKKFK